MKNGEKPMANPSVVLREEFDDWAILFNPDADLGHNGFGLNPTGVYVWKLLDGQHPLREMLRALHRDALGVSSNACEELEGFIQELIRQGLAGWGSAEACEDQGSSGPCPLCVRNVSEEIKFTYEPPRLVNLHGKQAKGCSHCGSGSQDTNCYPGACADYGGCSAGTSAGGTCGYGDQTGFAPCGPGNSTGFYCGDGTWATGSNCICGTHAASYKTCSAGPFNTCQFENHWSNTS